MDKIKQLMAKGKRLFGNPYFVGGIAMTMAVLLIILGDLLYNSINTLSIVASVIFAITGTVAVCSLVYFIVKQKLLQYSKKKKIVLVTLTGVGFNFFWVMPLIIMKVIVGESATFAGKFAMVLEGILYGVVFAGLFYTLFYRKKKRAFVAFVSVVLVLMATTGIMWSGFGKSVSEFAGVDFTYLDGGVAKGASWQLDGVPEYEGGKLSDVYNAGTMLAYDYLDEPTGEETYMQVAYQTHMGEFDAYCQKLSGNGFELAGENSLDGNKYMTYRKGEVIVHCYFTASKNETRIIKDTSGVSPAEFSYSTEVNGNATIYQYALLYMSEAQEFGGAVEQCGMNYVVRLADNSLFIIDGGMCTQSSDSAVEGFWDFCKEISGVKEGGKVRIACWFCTHGHSDHMEFFYKALAKYEGEYELERVMYNFPSSHILPGNTTIYTLQQRIMKYAPDALALKCHTGQHISLAGFEIDVLYTHEDNYNAVQNATDITKYNDSSTVLRFAFDGKTMLLLGDIDSAASLMLCKMYGEETFKTDIVQVAHHGFNLITELYDKTNPEYYLYPQGEKNVTRKNGSGQHTYNYLLSSHPNSKILFAGEKTYGLEVKGGEFVISERDYIGPDKYYDGSMI